MVESDSQFPEESLELSWGFYTQVLDRALNLIGQALKSPDPSPFLRAESQIAVAESQEAVTALTRILQQLSDDDATRQPIPLPQVRGIAQR